MLFCWRAELGLRSVVMLIIDEKGGAWARALPDILRQFLPTVLAKIAEFKIKIYVWKENDVPQVKIEIVSKKKNYPAADTNVIIDK